LPSEKSLVVSFWTFFQISRNEGDLEITETNTSFCWCRSIF